MRIATGQFVNGDHYATTQIDWPDRLQLPSPSDRLLVGEVLETVDRVEYTPEEDPKVTVVLAELTIDTGDLRHWAAVERPGWRIL